MCGCEKHWDPDARCSCRCRHAPWYRRTFYRYRAGGPAPGERVRRLQAVLELKGHHWLAICRIGGWVYNIRLVWR